MIQITQTKVVIRNSKDEIIVRGNCYAAVVASLLELPIEEVPNVEVFFGRNDTYWRDVMENFLYEKGYEIGGNEQFKIAFHRDIIEYKFDPSLIDKSLKYCKDKYYLVSGESKRGVKHIVIYKNGVMVWDPHPTREGLLTLECFEELVKIEK